MMVMFFIQTSLSLTLAQHVDSNFCAFLYIKKETAVLVPFSALTMLVGQHGRRQACKNLL